MPKTVKRDRNLAKTVTDRLLADIARGKLKAGDTLPSEPQLSRQLGVSRPTLRQALKPLENAGIIKARPRVGTVLCSADPGALGPLFGAQMALAGVSKRAMAEARSVLEQSIAELAARRRTRKDLAEMRAALNEERDAGSSWKKRVEAERRFHGAIIIAAHNSVLSSFREILTLYFDQALDGPSPRRDRKRMIQTTEGHEQIYEAIRDRNAGAAASLMRLHLEPTLKAVRARSQS